MTTSSNTKRSLFTKPVSNPIHLLQKFAPPQAIIHIGAGTGNGEMHQWRQWDVPHALIIDADRGRLNWAEPFIAENPDWCILSAVLAETEGAVDYYQASNPEEDGLISPQCLNSLWPNLHTIAQDLHPSRRLDHLLAEDCCAALEQADPLWVFVDCLPALPILKGAGAHIDRWSVLWLRVLLQFTPGIDEDTTLESTEAFLQPQGFRCVDVTESNHPAVGYALFVRDWRTVLLPRIGILTQANAVITDEKSVLAARQDTLQQEITTLTQARNEQGQLAAESQAKIVALTQERDNYAQQADERQAQIDTLTQINATLTEEKSALAARRDTLQQEITTLTQTRNEQGQLAAERQAKIEALTQECDNHARQAVERQAQIDTLTQSNTTLTEEKSTLAARRDTLQQEITTLTQARNEQGQLAAERQTKLDQMQTQLKQKDTHIAQLESDLAEFDARQRLLNDEITRAEVQIDLIKDVLLREPGL